MLARPHSNLAVKRKPKTLSTNVAIPIERNKHLPPVEAILWPKQELPGSREARTRRLWAPAAATSGWHWMMLVVWQPWAVAAVSGLKTHFAELAARLHVGVSVHSGSQFGFFLHGLQNDGVFEGGKSAARIPSMHLCRLSWFPWTSTKCVITTALWVMQARCSFSVEQHSKTSG